MHAIWNLHLRKMKCKTPPPRTLCINNDLQRCTVRLLPVYLDVRALLWFLFVYVQDYCKRTPEKSSTNCFQIFTSLFVVTFEITRTPMPRRFVALNAKNASCIESLSTAVVTPRPGGWRLSIRQSHRDPGLD
jgi:hypothetical protein